MEAVSGFEIETSDGERPGAFVRFPFDRSLLDRFREAFPRARWRRSEERWFVPGTTAAARLDVWVSRELSDLDRHADDKGRDAFSFEPLASPYLEVGEELTVRTPYSRRVVDLLRTVPFARWDADAKAWRIPFRGFERLRAAWPEIEEAARYAEPEARRQRKAERAADPQEALRQAERRKRRYPVPLGDPPPLDRPVATDLFGVVVFEDVGEAIPEDEALSSVFDHAHPRDEVFAWGRWRLPDWREVARVKPSDDPPHRGWRLPGAADLDERRRAMRSSARARETRARSGPAA
ncbi:hypothetical protein [Salinarimonas soli]|uniref:HARP domain-containing protein n=1 Tax=Salinarimonas soli TaxID=1638099 RepID=A0A5B2VHZ4_9HYPH|nr:hypothetical protein [Salinarimonas soli]KAA2238110.1 hypothetical protein F0L46_06445 [Salinarimonas soli]